MPNQIPPDALSAIEKAVRRHPHDVSAQEIMQGLEVEIPLRTLQYRLKSLIERNRLVMVGEGRWAKYRIPDTTTDFPAQEEADKRPLPLSGLGISIRDYVRETPEVTKPNGHSPDKQSEEVAAPHNPQAKSASALAQDLGLLVPKLTRRLRDQAHPGDLTQSQMSVLVRLENDGPATASSLARSEGMRQQSMGTVIASLVAKGLVSGAPDPTDGRQILLSLTEACSRWVKEGRAVRQVWLTRLIQARLSPPEQHQLAAAVELLKWLVDG